MAVSPEPSPFAAPGPAAGAGPAVTEFPFTLPRGLVDPEGRVHTEGAMRLATAFDEIEPLKDPRVRANPGYLVIILLARVVTRLGTLTEVNPGVIEGLFSGDLAHLQDLYNRVNGLSHQTLTTRCPQCAHTYHVEVPPLGGS